MNEQAIQEQYQHIVALLKQQRLKEAQSQLEAFLWNSGDWPLRNRLEQAQTSYQYMLQYMRQGIDDPERQKLYRQILTETWEVADQARLSLLDGVSTHYYHSLRNNRERLPKEYNIAALQKVLESFPDDLAVCQLMPDNQGLDALLQRHEQTAQVLFLSTWSNSDWSTEDEQQAKGLLESEMLPVNDLCLFTSAVMLSLMECFDTRKFSWLLNAVTHANTQVNQRALVGIAFALLFHPTRLSLSPSQSARLDSIVDIFRGECGIQDNLQEEMLRIILKRFIITCTRIAREKFDVDPGRENMFDVIRQFYVLVDSHFKEKKQVQDYADMLCRSPKTISNLFSLYGLSSPLRVIHERVDAEAKRLLLYTGKSAKEISEILGFEDLATFSRFFKKMNKESLSEYRKREKRE